MSRAQELDLDAEMARVASAMRKRASQAAIVAEVEFAVESIAAALGDDELRWYVRKVCGPHMCSFVSRRKAALS